MNWQPIETAPKDGTLVLLYFPGGCFSNDGNVCVGFWSTDGSDDWFSRECDSNSMTELGDFPTHWMPIPEPPSPTDPPDP
jgi:hypothetical protein